jgi:alkylation response protein AidB-like acyl-CoA dehydrogenase
MSVTAHPSVLLKPEWVDTIRKHTFAAEQTGLLQPEQLELIYKQQWFKLLVPAAYGGLEMALPELVRVEEALSWADGSLGWVITLCAGAGWFGGFTNPETAEQIFADSEVCLAGSGASTGTATIIPNGYRLNGTWKYASGVHHATRLTANCIIKQGEETVLNAEGNPLILPFVIDKTDAIMVPAWKYVGMMGTGSHAFELKDVEVDADRCFRIEPDAKVIDAPLYNYPFLQLAEATLAANLSGMATHFTDLCEPVFEQKLKESARLTDSQRVVMMNVLKDTNEKMQSARSHFYEALDDSWPDPSILQLKEVSRTSRLLAALSRESVDRLYPYCGLLAASPDTVINQVWRDLHTAGQHALLTFLE